MMMKQPELCSQKSKNLESENASKIVGLLLIQGHGKKKMIRLAFGPEALLHLVISQGKEGARSSH